MATKIDNTSVKNGTMHKVMISCAGMDNDEIGFIEEAFGYTHEGDWLVNDYSFATVDEALKHISVSFAIDLANLCAEFTDVSENVRNNIGHVAEDIAKHYAINGKPLPESIVNVLTAMAYCVIEIVYDDDAEEVED